MEKQQMSAFIMYVLAVLFLLTANLFGLSGPQKTPVLLANALLMLTTITLSLACMYGRLSLPKAFAVLTVTTQLFTCCEMVLYARSVSGYSLMLILGDVTLLAVNVMFSLMAYLRYTSYVLSGMAVAAYVACMCMTGDDALLNFCGIFLPMFLILAVLGSLLVRSTRKMDMENTEMRREEKELLDVLKMEKGQMRAYVRLAQQRQEPSETANMLDMLDTEARQNVIDNVKEAVASREMEHANLSQIFPELTPSEIEICRLVILGKGLKEVCRELGKAESNITSQRRHIRIKLGLQPSDNLKKVLQARFDEMKTADVSRQGIKGYEGKGIPSARKNKTLSLPINMETPSI